MVSAVKILILTNEFQELSFSIWIIWIIFISRSKKDSLDMRLNRFTIIVNWCNSNFLSFMRGRGWLSVNIWTSFEYWGQCDELSALPGLVMQCISETKDRTKTDHLLWRPQHLRIDEEKYGNLEFKVKRKRLCRLRLGEMWSSGG